MGETGTDGQMGSSESSLHPLMIPAHSCGGVGPLPFHVSPSEGASWRCGDCQAEKEPEDGQDHKDPAPWILTMALIWKTQISQSLAGYIAFLL